MKTRYKNHQYEQISSNKVVYFSQRFPALTLSIAVVVFFSFVGTIIGGWEGFVFYSLFMGIPLTFGWALVGLFYYISLPHKPKLKKKKAPPYILNMDSNAIQTHKYISEELIKDMFKKYLLYEKLHIKRIMNILMTGAGILMLIIWSLIVINQIPLFINIVSLFPIYFMLSVFPFKYFHFLKEQNKIKIIVLKNNFDSYARVGNTLYFF